MDDEHLADSNADNDVENKPLDPQAALDVVGNARTSAHRQTRWLAIYFLLYGVGIAIVGILIGASNGRSVAIVMAAWVAFVVLTVVWANSKRATIKNMGGLMAIWVACFCATWTPTVVIGANYYPGNMTWWVSCAIVTVLVHLALAAVVWQRSTRV